ncbi:MAG: PorT family protein [Bacteroidales bacterium]|nr:PorT family protein [Bacteroidales bacterium]
MNNFKRHYFLILLLFISLFLTGQSYLGALGGINFSKLSGDVPEKVRYKSLTGANAGVTFDLPLGKSILLSIQPSFSMEGTKLFYKVDPLLKSVDSVRFRLNYISLPLLLKITSTKERFYAIGGLEAGFLADSFVKVKDKNEKEEINAKIAEPNIVMHFGIGYRIPLGLPRMFVELRYVQGIINLTNEPGELNYIPRVKTTGFKILTGIELPLKKSSN